MTYRPAPTRLLRAALQLALLAVPVRASEPARVEPHHPGVRESSLHLGTREAGACARCDPHLAACDRIAIARPAWTGIETLPTRRIAEGLDAANAREAHE